MGKVGGGGNILKSLRFKFLSLILFEIWHLQNFISIFSKGRNFTRGDNAKKKICVCYFSIF